MHYRVLTVAATCLVVLCGPRAALTTDFQAEFERLDKKIGAELSEPTPSPKYDVEPYVHWLHVKAADRDRANALALEAGEQNPYFQRLFGDLAQDAQMSGDYTVDLAMRMLVRFDEARDEYWTICERVERYGKPLWEATIANNFDREIVRDRVRRQMRASINNLDNKWLWCCEAGQSVAEREGHYIQGDSETVYLPRSAFVKGSKHADNVNPYVDEWLAEVERCVRKPCEFFGLIGIRDTEATPMMEEYLEDTLCLKHDIGHKHYLELAEQYQLNNAKEYIEGFYAKLHGHVWIEESGQRRPANGARVTVTDPKDQTTWQATADAEGHYEIEKGPLHNHKGKDAEDRCPVFKISAEHEGDRADDTYEGPLREPDESAEYTKDLVIQRDERWELEIEYRERVSYDHWEDCSDPSTRCTKEEHISGALDYRLTASLKPASWQPADALRPYQAKEEEAKAQFAQPRPDYVPSTTGEQLEQIEREEARMRARANEVVGPGGRHDFIALGVELQLKDDFVHTRNHTIVTKNGRFEDDYRGEWHADQQGPIPLNIRLTTHANKNSYHITLTDHDPMDTGNPEAHHPFTIPWRYLVRHTSTGQPPLNCSGTAEVEDNFPHIVFVDVPDDKLTYDGSQRVLSGEHSWTEGASELDVSGMETPGCSEKRALRSKNRVFPADSVTKTLKWTLRRLGGPGAQ